MDSFHAVHREASHAASPERREQKQTDESDSPQAAYLVHSIPRLRDEHEGEQVREAQAARTIRRAEPG